MEKQYLTLQIPDTDLQVIVKLDDEGVIVDVTDKDNDEPIASTWKMYDEFGVEVKQLDDRENSIRVHNLVF